MVLSFISRVLVGYQVPVLMQQAVARALGDERGGHNVLDIGCGLRPTNRYAHSQTYIAIGQFRMDLVSCDKVVLRQQKGEPVEGYLPAPEGLKTRAET